MPACSTIITLTEPDKEVEFMSKTYYKRKQNGWRLFLKAAAFTLLAVGLIALGFFGAMLVTGFFM